jgi:hypothetical protein
MSLFRYTILVLGVGATTFALAWGLALRRADAPTRWAAAFGGALAVANTVAAHALVRWSTRRSTNAFLGAVLGGMVGRMAVVLGAVVAGILLLGLPRLPLAVSVLSYFVLFMLLELSVLHRSTSAPVASAGGKGAPR